MLSLPTNQPTNQGNLNYEKKFTWRCKKYEHRSQNPSVKYGNSKLVIS